MTSANSINVSATGAVSFNSGTNSFTGGTLSVPNGGTGATTLTGVLTGNGASAMTASALTQHGAVVAGASNALSTIAPGTSGNVLTSNGTDWTSAASVAGGFTSIAIQTFTSTGTYTPTTGMKYCLVECIGGGAGGGGAASTNSSQVSCGGGGGSGEYRRGYFSSSTIGVSQSVTINSGGSGGTAGSNGSNGGSVVFGSLITANPGTGGGGGAAGTTSYPGSGDGGGGGSGGTFSSEGNQGGQGVAAFISGGSLTLGGYGADSPFGGGASGQGGNSGNNAKGKGAGGAGGAQLPSSAGTTGGNGTTGIIIVTEFIS